MQTKDMTSSYVELSSQAYTLFVDAFASANQRALDYSKSVWQIVSRPYASNAIETAMRENADRTNQIVSLTIGELQTNGQKTAEFAEKLVAHGAKVQESYVHAMRGLVDTGVSNMKYAKDVATQQYEDATKRLEDMTATVSSN
jgi:hypothetical protein